MKRGSTKCSQACDPALPNTPLVEALTQSILEEEELILRIVDAAQEGDEKALRSAALKLAALHLPGSIKLRELRG